MIPARLKLALLRRRLTAAERDRHTVALNAAEELSARDAHINRLRQRIASAEVRQITHR